MANPPVFAQSSDTKVAAVKGETTGDGGFGVWGTCDTGHGIHGDSLSSRGVVGTSKDFHGVFGHSANNVGVAGESDAMWGVLGVSKSAAGIGVHGKNEAGGDGVVGIGRRGVVGHSDNYQGVYGHSHANSGVVGESEQMHAVFAVTKGAQSSGVYATNKTPGNTGAGVWGDNPGGDGVVGTGRRGVIGMSPDFQGVYGHSDTNAGVVGESKDFDGVYGVSHSLVHAGVSGHNPGGLAGYFDGNVAVTGDICLTNADCAEEFDISGIDKVDQGTVMVVGNDGVLFESQEPYDKRVAGVISGAGDYKPAIVLDKRPTPGNRQAIALLGKVFCKVDARFGAIEVGDLLTSSPTPGHAMKTSDPLRAFGAVMGKALRPLAEGRGLIPILIALQ